MAGTGLYYPVAVGSGKWIEFHDRESPRAELPREDEPNGLDASLGHDMSLEETGDMRFRRTHDDGIETIV